MLGPHGRRCHKIHNLTTFSGWLQRCADLMAAVLACCSLQNKKATTSTAAEQAAAAAFALLSEQRVASLESLNQRDASGDTLLLRLVSRPLSCIPKIIGAAVLRE